jgi:MFS family permease
VTTGRCHPDNPKELVMTTLSITAPDRGYDPTSRKAAIVAGLLFLTATVTFMLGDSLIMGFFAGPTSTSTLTVGVALQAVCAIAGAGIGLALLGVLSRHSQALARGYLAFRSLEGVAILAIGGYILATTSLVAHYEILIYGFTGTAGLMLSYILHRARLVPSWLSWLGLGGYIAILLAIPSTLLDVATLDSGPGMLLYVPGGLFELLLPILLITRGFRRTQTHEPTSAPVVPAA